MIFAQGSRVLVVLPTAIGDVAWAVPWLESLSKAGRVVRTVLDDRLAGLGLSYGPYVEREYLVSIKKWRPPPASRPQRALFAYRVSTKRAVPGPDTCRRRFTGRMALVGCADTHKRDIGWRKTHQGAR